MSRWERIGIRWAAVWFLVFLAFGSGIWIGGTVILAGYGCLPDRTLRSVGR